MPDHDVMRRFSVNLRPGKMITRIGMATAALAALMMAAPVSDASAAKKRKKKTVKVASVGALSSPAVDVPSRNPKINRKDVRGQLQLVISIPDQRIDVFDGTVRVASSRVSTGKRGHATPRGVFSVIQKNRRHYSNIYGGAPMPYMQRLTWSGIALHAGHVPRYPASHGCIRLPHGFARKLFGMTRGSTHIVVNRGRQKPSVLDHEALFQPRVRVPRNVASEIAKLDIDGLSTDDVSGRDLMVLNALKADHFVKELRAAYHPNDGSHPRATVRLAQTLLKFIGYDIARPDGDPGPKTRRLISQFQKSQGMKRTGRPSNRVVLRLYQTAGARMTEMSPDKADAMLVPPTIDEPLRILIARAKGLNQVKRAQQMLDQLGYRVGVIDGAMGRNTRAAIKEFRTRNDLAGPAEVDKDLLQALADASGAADTQDANGRLFVRQGYRDIFSVPVTIKDEVRPLGTHIFTAMNFGEDRSSKVAWTALTVAEQGVRRNKRKRRRKKNRRIVLTSTSEGIPALPKSDAASVLDRIVIPEEVRARIEEAMMPGSSIIVTDHGNSHETGEGTDFIVLTK